MRLSRITQRNCLGAGQLLPPLNSMFAKQLYFQAEGIVDLSSVSKSLFQFEKAEKSQKRSKLRLWKLGHKT